MAGSYEHVRHGWSSIENMGDAAEAVEELLYLVSCFGDERDIQEALAEFYKFKRGEANPSRLYETESGWHMLDFGRAYLETQDAMNR